VIETRNNRQPGAPEGEHSSRSRTPKMPDSMAFTGGEVLPSGWRRASTGLAGSRAPERQRPPPGNHASPVASVAIVWRPDAVGQNAGPGWARSVDAEVLVRLRHAYLTGSAQRGSDRIPPSTLIDVARAA